MQIMNSKCNTQIDPYILAWTLNAMHQIVECCNLKALVFLRPLMPIKKFWQSNRKSQIRPVQLTTQWHQLDWIRFVWETGLI
jgi:hypothetical protein